MQTLFSADSILPTGYNLTNLEFTPGDLEIACTELKGNAAAGPDGFSIIVLKECKKELKLSLYYLCKSV